MRVVRTLRWTTAAAIVTMLAFPLLSRAQQVDSTQLDNSWQRWNLYWQATSIGMAHDAFTSPYSGPFSLEAKPEKDVSLTSTFFFGVRITDNTQFYFDPELAGGRGFSGVNGLANPPNGELPRVAAATPTPYVARAYITHDFGFGDEREEVSSDENQLGGARPERRYSITIGRFSITDFFDGNSYTHDPRKQFMAWAVMYNGAWDYPADTRGYTWGWVHEYHTKFWSLRYGSAEEPRVANGARLERRPFRDRGDVVEGEADYSLNDHPGAVRLLGYLNHARAGNYAEAIQIAESTDTTPNVIATRQVGARKYGTGISADQELTKDLGAFLRLGWNDGKTESFAFTAIDRLVSSGVSFKGTRWHRPDDEVATALTAAGISGVHSLYLRLGGHDFLLGDGTLRYGPESSWESYYSARLFKDFFVSYDVQHDVNPAYNQDRGPVWIQSLRLHLEMGRESLVQH